MAALETMRTSGWSYSVGYSHDFKGYLARVWKPRDKPTRFPCNGGGDVILLTFCVSAMGDSIEEAANEAARLATSDPDGRWFDRLPLKDGPKH